MVDVRATLAAAEAEGLISLRVRDKLAVELKRLHFPERSLGRLEQVAAVLPGSEGAALVAWLRAGHAVSQKRRDAEVLLRRLAAGVEAVQPPSFAFERVEVWERFRAAADAADIALPSRAAAE
jgi:hypothetical protein